MQGLHGAVGVVRGQRWNVIGGGICAVGGKVGYGWWAGEDTPRDAVGVEECGKLEHGAGQAHRA